MAGKGDDGAESTTRVGSPTPACSALLSPLLSIPQSSIFLLACLPICIQSDAMRSVMALTLPPVREEQPKLSRKRKQEASLATLSKHRGLLSLATITSEESFEWWVAFMASDTSTSSLLTSFMWKMVKDDQRWDSTRQCFLFA